MSQETNHAKWLVLLIELALLVVTVNENLSVIWYVLPAGAELAGYGALAAADLGLLLWTVIYMFGQNGKTQRLIIGIMIGVDFIGVGALTTAGMFIHTAQKGIIGKPQEDTMIQIVLGIAFLIMSNILAAILYTLHDPVKLVDQAEKDAQMAITEAKIKNIRRAAPQLARELTPLQTQDWLDNMKAQILSELSQPLALPEPTNMQRIPEPAITAAADSGTDEGVTQVFTKGRGSQN